MDVPIDVSKIKLEDIKTLLPTPKTDREFGDLGRLAIIGGSYLNMNSPIISALSASKISLDSIYLVIPEKHARIRGFPSISISPIFMPDFKITKGVVSKILKYVKRKRINAQTFHIGPGLAGYRRYIIRLVEELAKIEDTFIVLDTGSIYPEVLELDIDWSRVILSPHEGELKQILGSESVSTEDIYNMVKDRYNLMAKLLRGIYFFDRDGGLRSYLEYRVVQPTRYGSIYVYTGLLSGFLAHVRDIGKAAILSQYTFMKTLEKVGVNGCLHWEIEDLIYTLKDVLKDLCTVK